jgi:hypothetical protein
MGIGDVYEFKVTAVNLGGESAPTNVVRDVAHNPRPGKVRSKNRLNGANAVAFGLARARGLHCRNDLWQTVCLDFSPAGRRPMTMGDYLSTRTRSTISCASCAARRSTGWRWSNGTATASATPGSWART